MCLCAAVQELVPHISDGAAASLLQDLLLPALLPLLDDPSTAPGTFPIAAQLVGAAAATGAVPSAAMNVDGAVAANGNGMIEHSSAADALLSKMAEVLDDR